MRYASINDPTIIVGYTTHPGKTGKNNEDDYALFEAELTDVATMQVALVADGIGGNLAGKTASHLTAQTFYDTFRALPQTPPRRRLLDAIETANRAVYDRALEDPNLQGMGTTVVAAALLGNELFVAHAGDSRAYLIRGGRAFQLTADHTWAQEAIEAGRLTPEQARAHPNRHVIKRFLGIAPEVEIDTDILDVTATPPNPDQMHLARKLDTIRSQPGDVILLCSDGLTDVVSDKQIEQTLKQYGPHLQDAAHHLVELANKAGGPDNITVLLLQRRDPSAPLAATTAVGPSRQTPGRGLLLVAALVLLVGAALAIAGRQLGNGTEPASTTEITAVVVTPTAVALATQAPIVAPPTPTRAETVVASVFTAGIPLSATTAIALVVEEPTVTATLPPTSTPVPEGAAGTQSVVTTTVTTGSETIVTAIAPTLAPMTVESSSGNGSKPPTSTPVPDLATDTPIPTAMPTATRIAPATGLAAGTPNPRATAAQRTGTGNIPAISVQLLSPNVGDTVDGSRVFVWQPDSALPDGYSFEPVFWASGQDPLVDGRGWGGSTSGNQLPIDLTKFPEVQPGPYKWGVRLIEVNSDKAVRLVSEERTIIVQRPNNSSNDGGGGNTAPSSPSDGDKDK